MIGSPILLAFGTYVLAAASPGPSNMAIMDVAMRDGRTRALMLASGVITGSLFWAILAATGISALLAAYAQALLLIKVVGGVYLLYLALRAGRSAMQSTADRTSTVAGQAPRYLSLYRQGVLMHISNPKAIMSWMSIMSLGLRGGRSTGHLIGDHRWLRSARRHHLRRLRHRFLDRHDDCLLRPRKTLDPGAFLGAVWRRGIEASGLDKLISC
ncbi:LysE family translocator [Pseudomonas alvandae]|uniref:LysE family translocator n=1 Tax=Pseudomonas canavaninivorans TaxID=2842348 RepID=UPI002FEEDA7C